MSNGNVLQSEVVLYNYHSRVDEVVTGRYVSTSILRRTCCVDLGKVDITRHTVRNELALEGNMEPWHSPIL
jgi:hypothetical protein